MKAFVAVTDGDLFRFWRARPAFDEIAFWQPGGGRRFRALDPGEPFLFKLHSPENYIAGGAFFVHSTLLPVSVLWEAFGPKNGTATLAGMRERIERYRRLPAGGPEEPARPPRPAREDYEVGAIVLQAPFFFDESEWIRGIGNCFRRVR